MVSTDGRGDGARQETVAAVPDAAGVPSWPEPTGPGDGAPGRLLEQLLDVLDLRADGVDDRGQDVFQGQTLPQPHGRVFGGQVLAQAVVAATRTVGDGRAGAPAPGDPPPPAAGTARPIHSMHGYFLRAGDSRLPITFAVERLRDGRSFTARRVHALQHGRPLLSMIASFQTPADGVDHQVAMPDVPGPEDLRSTVDLLGSPQAPPAWQPPPGDELDEGARAWAERWARSRPIDLRHVPVADLPPDVGQAVWLRTTAPLPDDDALHRAVLAFASDDSLLEPVLVSHGLTWATRGLRMTSLDHALWWHRPARVDEWLLYAQSSPTASGARGLATGRLHRRDGVLAATVAQEGLVRPPRPGAGAGIAT
ncbi:acyl-CoA thioesterase-2 [Pseudokineococcus lusitanus]|uniref:Acyl-CoA thioesterase-2 n=1 Tax=Pseudokineococcus lusitanus TaxID=763993 RepID=A0A3N1HU02_9ACTN|nr:acyl-CoA thioesterase II [Pseudokineococcus lusitanus]ROP45900.1 acyl-CoA thioesterase-2 [Pseudokineococcus lusitanus]